MAKIGQVIGWKFNHQQGMSTRDGVITEFPGGIPSQSDQDSWLAEYDIAFPAGYKAWASLRAERNTKLAESDWTQSPDSPLTAEAKAEWATYRQSLRDLPSNTPDPTNPSWPDAPE